MLGIACKPCPDLLPWTCCTQLLRATWQGPLVLSSLWGARHISLSPVTVLPNQLAMTSSCTVFHCQPTVILDACTAAVESIICLKSLSEQTSVAVLSSHYKRQPMSICQNCHDCGCSALRSQKGAVSRSDASAPIV